MSEREQFETAYRQEFGKRWVCPQRQDMFKRETNRYAHLSVQDMWVMWQAARAQPAQAEAVPPGYVMVPVDVLKAASESLGSFVSDNGWTDADMQAMDNLDAIIAQQKGQQP